jgi:tRNA pseudouridine55 synthase
LTPSGVLVVDKPQGLTSRRVAAQVGSLAGNVKSGHTGTLDPLATGVLVVCLGRATLLTRFLGAGPKEYDVEVLLGVETDTYDLEGAVVQVREASRVGFDEIESILGGFRGNIQQLAPPYSAVKHKGRRLYEYARQGIDVERKPRKVDIESIEITSLNDSEGKKLLRLKIICGPGAYVRSLAHDIGQRLGCGACVTGLRRLRSGAFSIDRAVTLDKLVSREAVIEESMITIEDATDEMPSIRVGEEGSIAVGQGKPLRLDWISEIFSEEKQVPAQTFRVLDGSGMLLALYGPRRPEDEKEIVARPVRVLRPVEVQAG